MVRATVAWACAWEVSAGDSCDGHVGQQHRSKRGDYGGQSEVASSIEHRASSGTAEGRFFFFRIGKGMEGAARNKGKGIFGLPWESKCIMG